MRDKLLLGAVRAAYADYLARDGQPILSLFIELDPHEVDVNVHPAKTEVRFRDGGLVRALIVRSLQEALTREGRRSASTGGTATVASLRPNIAPRTGWDWRGSSSAPGLSGRGRDRVRRFSRGRAGGVCGGRAGRRYARRSCACA